MKKLFTLIAAALMAVTANAKEAIDLSSVATDGTITFTGTWQWKGINYSTTDDAGNTDYADKSAYKYVLVVYSGGTCGDVNVIAQYNPDGTTGQYVANYYNTTVSASVNATGGLIAVPLDATHSNTVNSIAFQNHNTAGTLVVKEAYFASEEEYEAAKAEADKIEKQTVLDATGGTHTLAAKDWGWDSKWLDKDVSDFNTLVFEIASVKGHGQITIQGTDATGAKLGDMTISLPETTEAKTYACDISKMKTLQQYAYQNLNKPDGDEYGKDDIAETTIVVTKVYATSKTADEVTAGISHIVTPAANANAPIYNLAGQRVSKTYKGVVIQNGRKYLQK